VDRLSDDYPRLIALGQPQLNVNISAQDIQRYSPQALDLINLETNSFETIPLTLILKNHGEIFPLVEKLVSVYQEDHLVFRPRVQINFLTDDLVLTFDGLIKQTRFVQQIKQIIDVTRERLGYPVDIEFACDGKSLYLLQCRPQSDGAVHTPASIPEDTPADDVLFTASKFISNGIIPDITHVVYIDPDKYGNLESRTTLLVVGRAVGRLNSLLPRRQFVLMGPGRWGSRGDIKLGVSVTYSDISNTALLVEIARKKGSYVPDLSFGTHFFQDLVEASIRYLPLYPDEEPNLFNTSFFHRSKNLLSSLLPEFSHLEDVVFVIDVPRETRDRILRVQMNADIDKAMAYFTPPAKSGSSTVAFIPRETGPEVNYWQWREKMAEKIAEDLDFEKFGVQAFYLFGSTKNCTAGMGSDIDILIHFIGDQAQRDLLLNWLEGWSRCLAEINYLKTGYVSDGLLDVHLVTPEDIEKKTSFAVKINAISDAARLMRERSRD
jgi:predicted nucleotidyltransferase